MGSLYLYLFYGTPGNVRLVCTAAKEHGSRDERRHGQLPLRVARSDVHVRLPTVPAQPTLAVDDDDHSDQRHVDSARRSNVDLDELRREPHSRDVALIAAELHGPFTRHTGPQGIVA